MSYSGHLKKQKIGFLGAGNMGEAIIRGLLDAGFEKSNLLATTRTDHKLQKISDQYGIVAKKNNEELIEESDIVILGVKPQNLYEIIEPLTSTFSEGQIVISLAAGISLEQLERWILNTKQIARVMPNTAIKIKESVIGYAVSEKSSGLDTVIEDLFGSIAMVVPAEEGEQFQALMVACSSGIGFVYELMSYFQDWLVGYDFDEEQAKDMVMQTFLGAAEMVRYNENAKLSELQARVVSKKGVTDAGLTAMREMEIEGLLRMCFEKAVLRDRQLGEISEPTGP